MEYYSAMKKNEVLICATQMTLENIMLSELFCSFEISRKNRSIGFPGGSVVKNLPLMQETQAQSLGWEDPPEEEMETQSSILAWRIPWTEDPGGVEKSQI